MRSKLLIPFLLALIVLSGCGLTQEPPIVQTPIPRTELPPDLGKPAQRIDLARGAEIFFDPQGCVACHGTEGRGDGTVAASFTCQLVSFPDDALNRGKAMNAWFAIVSNGNRGQQSCLMPPWRGRFNEQDRWNVTAYIYSLRYTAERMTLGKQVYEQQCAVCHGAQGTGDGPDAATLSKPLSDLSAAETLISRSDAQLNQLLVDGLEDGTHKFDGLTEEQKWAVVSHVRALSWDNTQVIVQGGVAAAAASTPVPVTPTVVAVVPDTPAITVSGKVRSGTQGATVPEGLPLTLRVIERGQNGQFSDALKLEANSGADGAFTFNNVQRRNGAVYVIAATHQGVLQTSTPIPLRSGSGPVLDLSFAVYDVTDDPGVIRVDVQRVFVDFAGPQTALIQQGIRFRNVSDRVYAVGAGDQQRSIRLSLPDTAAEPLISQDSAGWTLSPDNKALLNSLPLPPNDTTGVQYSYRLNFDGALTVQQITEYAIQELIIQVPRGGGAYVADEGFRREQPLILDTGVYDTYFLPRVVSAGEPVRFTVRFAATDEAQRRTLLSVLAVVAVALVGAVVIAFRRLRRDRPGPAPTPAKPAAPSTPDEIIRHIAALDDQFEAGRIDKVTYEAQRKKLKDSLSRRL